MFLCSKQAEMKDPCSTRETSKRKDYYFMEEKQIQDFVHRVSNDEDLRKELIQNPDGVIMRESFSPRVAQIVTRLVPHLTVHRSVAPQHGWWY